MRHLLLPIALLACALATPAFADSPPPHPGKKLCKDNPAKCEEMKSRREEFCKKNPQTCETRKAARDQRRKYCKENPEKCEKLKEERHERREERREERHENMRQTPATPQRPLGPPR